MAGKCPQLRRLSGAALLAVFLSLAATSRADTQPTTTKTKPLTHTVHHRKTRKAKVRGQKAIDEDRTRQIQEALIREHYLKGEPSGKWDATTQLAMHRYQADQGWQTKTIPDSRALIRLGLGPDNQHLLNPESAMTTAPAKQTSASSTSASSTTQPSTPAASMPAAPVSAPASGVADPPSR